VSGSPGAARLTRAKSYLPAHPIPDDWRESTQHRNRALKSLLTGNPADGCNAAVAWAKTFNFPDIDEARWSGENAILIYDWCYSHMSAADRQTIQNNWNARIQALNEDSWGGLHMAANNYFWGYLRNSLLWGIASYHDNPLAQGFIDHALAARMDKFKAWYEVFGRGGATPEGGQYGPYMLGYPVIAFTSAADYGSDAWSATPFFRDAVYYLHYAAPAKATQALDGAPPRFELFPFNDDQFFVDGGTAERAEYADFLGAMALRNSDKPLGAQAQAWMSRIGIEAAWHVRAELASATVSGLPPILPVDYYAAGAQYLYGGKGSGSAGTAVMLQLGSFDASTNEPAKMVASGGVGHNHLDVGNFQIWRNGRWLTRETTGYSNTIPGLAGAGTRDVHEAIAHNTVLFEGRGQIDGLRGLAKVTRLQSNPDFLFVAADLLDAYRAVANEDWQAEDDWPFAEAVTREFVYVRRLDTLLVLDRLQSGSDSQGPLYQPYYKGPRLDATQVRKSFVLHAGGGGPTGSLNPFIVQGPGRVTASVGDQRMDLVTLLPAAPAYRVIQEGGSVGQFRLEFDASGTATTYFLNAISLRNQDEVPVTVSISGTQSDQPWKIALSHPARGTAEVTFNPGLVSQGGSVKVADTTRSLRNDVQGMQVTDNGPAWATTTTAMAATKTIAGTRQASNSRPKARQIRRKKKILPCLVFCYRSGQR